MATLSSLLLGSAFGWQDPDDWRRWSIDQPSPMALDGLTHGMAEVGLYPSRRDPRIFLHTRGEPLHLAEIPQDLLAFGLHLTADSLGAEQLRSLKANPHLRSLTLIGFPDGEQCLLTAGRQKELRLLSLMNCDVTDAQLAHCAELIQLETLILKGTRVRGPGLQELTKLPALETLELDLTTEQFHQLLTSRLVHLLPVAHGRDQSTAHDDKDVVELELNGFYGYSVSDDMLNGLHQLQSLKRLSLIESKVTDQAFPGLLRLPQLHHLNLERTKITDETLRGLSASLELRSLVLDETAVTEVGVKHLLSFPRLTELYLNRCKLDDAAIESLSRLSHLTKLEIGATSVRFEVDVAPDSFPRLNHLNLNGSILTNKGLESIARLPALEWLDVTLCRVDDEGIENLRQCRSLEVLYLNRSRISDVAVQHLASLKTLRVLSLNSTEITDDGLRHLAALSNLESLILSGTQVSDAAVHQLQTALPKCEIFR